MCVCVASCVVLVLVLHYKYLLYVLHQTATTSASNSDDAGSNFSVHMSNFRQHLVPLFRSRSKPAESRAIHGSILAQFLQIRKHRTDRRPLRSRLPQLVTFARGWVQWGPRFGLSALAGVYLNPPMALADRTLPRLSCALAPRPDARVRCNRVVTHANE